MTINKDVFESTKKRLIKINMVAVVCFMALLMLCTFMYFRGVTFKSIDEDMTAELKYVIGMIEKRDFLSEINSPIRLINPKDMVYIYEDGDIKYYTENEYFDSLIPEGDSNGKEGFSNYSTRGYSFRELNIDIGNYRIQIIRNIDSEINSIKQLIYILLSLGLLAFIFVYMIAVYLTKKALIPIENAWNEQAKFIQDASHELRTPIAIVSSKLESILKKPESTINDEAESIAAAMKETRRLKKMVNDLLALTKGDGVVKVNKEEFDLVDMISEITEDYFDIAEFQEKEFEFNADLDNIDIYTDKNMLKQLLLIFIDNAFKYTESGDKISIDIEENNEKVTINIIDTGIGIKEEDIPHLFDRFFRSNNVRNRDIDGSGIGLSIASVLSGHIGADISVKSKFEEGSTFSINMKKGIKIRKSQDV